MINTAHFFLKIEDHMEQNVKYLIKSIELFSGLDNFYITIMIPKGHKLKSSYIKKIADFYYYENSRNLNPPWSGAIRYFLDSKSDVCFLVDSDMLVVGSILNLLDKIIKNDKIYGCPAYFGAFSNFEWKEFLREFNLQNNDFVRNIEGGNSPKAYLNAGFIGTNKKSMNFLASFVEKYVFSINNKKINYKGQMALCLAILDSKISFEHLDYNYNFGTHLTEKNFDDFHQNYNKTISDLKLIHYCKDKNLIYNKNTKIEKIKNCIEECSKYFMTRFI